jgi:Tfp pilus assembly ATPase PilU
MQTMDQSLLHLYHLGFITLEEALGRCREPETAKKSLARSGAV